MPRTKCTPSWTAATSRGVACRRRSETPLETMALVGASVYLRAFAGAVEMTFGIMKQRFNAMLFRDPKHIENVFWACCTLQIE